MTPTPVGMRCPECSAQKTQVRTAQAIRTSDDPVVTKVLVGINVLAFVGMLASGGSVGVGEGGTLVREGALFGPAVADGEYWRLVTSGFLHAGIIHVGFNMYLLWLLGGMLEPALGHVRFAALYFTALLAGSFGALLFSPDAVTIGASGAVFGLMGAAIIEMRKRGIDIMQSGIGPLLILNLIITFIPGFNISIGGHLGGLIGGVIGALAIELGTRRRSTAVSVAACVVISAAAVVGSLAVADTTGLGIDL
jgi:membrane associated rhomboid family serine protease